MALKVSDDPVVRSVHFALKDIGQFILEITPKINDTTGETLKEDDCDKIREKAYKLRMTIIEIEKLILKKYSYDSEEKLKELIVCRVDMKSI